MAQCNHEGVGEMAEGQRKMELDVTERSCLPDLSLFFFFFCLFAFSRAAPAAHGGSQARG